MCEKARRSISLNGIVPSSPIGTPSTLSSVSPSRRASLSCRVVSTLHTRTPHLLAPSGSSQVSTSTYARSPRFSRGAHVMPSVTNPLYFPLRSMSVKKWCTTDEGMMNPTFSASSLPWKANPMTLLLSAFRAGPPELPELTAASICTHSRLKPECAYSCTSTRDTTPAVTHKLSPPVGKPTTTKLCCSSGTLPNSSAHVPFQKESSATVRRARSHS
mmetsp:Transcript_65342/g.160890  ORF Transcript_65342/g.160890 Transcript_65342/m.160890 type:complete len:216 (-) Transcript_65342:373-1020(-)